MRLPGTRSSSQVLVSSLVLIASACSGGSSGAGTPSQPRYLLPDVANPVNAAVAAEPENAVTASIPLDGGTLTATGSDGTVYTLTVPADALLAPVTITLTPLHSVTGVDFLSGRWIGARLDPEGLHFLAPVTFRMTPPEGEREDAFAFSAYGDGRELHGQPLTADASRLELTLYHFSSAGAELCGADCGGGTLKAPLPSTPTDWEARLQNFLENLFRQERERQLAGQPSDPDLWPTVKAVLKEYFTRVIAPLLPQLMTDCSFSEANLWRAIAFDRMVQLMGLGADFTAEDDQVRGAMMAAIENCFGQTAEPCIDQTNLEQMGKLIQYMRMYQLLAGVYPPFDVRDPGLQCGRIWTGTSRVVYSASGDPSTSLVTMSASFVFEVDDAASTQDMQVLRPKSGSVDWEYLAVDGGCTTRGGPQAFTLLPEDGTITLSLSGTETTFTATGEMFRTDPVATYHTTCTDGRDYTEQQGMGGTWLLVPEGTPAFPDGRGTMTGQLDIPPFSSEWSFSR